MLTSLSELLIAMKPDARRPIYQTMVSTTPSYQSGATAYLAESVSDARDDHRPK
jgi:hypothetical protein